MSSSSPSAIYLKNVNACDLYLSLEEVKIALDNMVELWYAENLVKVDSSLEATLFNIELK
jgi:hypothetical protein